MKDSPFYPQAELMLKCIPAIAEEKAFALKGGTAINMFIRSMPRLSVDIDLTYVPIENRDTTLKNISAALENIAKRIEATVPGTKVQRTKKEGRIIKLVVQTPSAYIKIEPNEVLRGTTAEPQTLDLVEAAEDLFELSVSIPVVPLADLYGGKICAALDRQHPRDLFDIKVLLENEGITDEIRRGFIIFLASHDRPMHEVIRPTLKDIAEVYDKEFKEMLEEPPSLEELYQARDKLITTLQNDMTEDEKNFLLSLKRGEPNWELLPIANAEKLPGIQWKLRNIRKMTKEKHQEQIKLLAEPWGGLTITILAFPKSYN